MLITTLTVIGVTLTVIGVLTSASLLVIKLFGKPKQWKILDGFRRKPRPDQVLVLIAELEFDTDGRWSGAISEHIARMKKRQRTLGRAIKPEIDSEGELVINEAKAVLEKHGCDVLLTGRVGPDQKTAQVQVINRCDGIIDEVTLEIGNHQILVEHLARMNLAVEKAIALNIEREVVQNDASPNRLETLKVSKNRLVALGMQALHPRTEKFVGFQKALVDIRTGEATSDIGQLAEARETLEAAHSLKWLGEDNSTAALHVGNALVFSQRITGDQSSLKEAQDWYQQAAQNAKRAGDDKKWIEAQNAAAQVSVEIFLSTGERDWLETARLEQEQAVRLYGHRLDEENLREAQGILAEIDLLLAYLQGDGEEVLNAAERIRAAGMEDILSQICAVGGSAQLSELLHDPALEAERWSRECEKIDKSAYPQEWALAQNRKGIAFAEMAERTGNLEQLIEGEKALLKALSIWTEERSPHKYALAMDNIGVLLSAKFRMTGEKKLLDQALDAQKSAIRYRRQEIVPREWVSTCRNMGRTLLALAGAYKDPKFAEEAVGLLTEAKNECLRLEDKILQQEISLSLGLLFNYLAKKTGREDYLNAAIENLESVLDDERIAMDGARKKEIEAIIGKLKQKKELGKEPE